MYCMWKLLVALIAECAELKMVISNLYSPKEDHNLSAACFNYFKSGLPLLSFDSMCHHHYSQFIGNIQGVDSN